jgi:hypothetical protein
VHHTSRRTTHGDGACLAVGVLFEDRVGEVGLREVRVGRNVRAARAAVMVRENGVRVAATIGAHASFAVQLALCSTFVRRQGSELRVLFVSDESPHVTPELKELVGDGRLRAWRRIKSETVGRRG